MKPAAVFAGAVFVAAALSCHAQHRRWRDAVSNEPFCIETFENEGGTHHLRTFGPNGELLRHEVTLPDGGFGLLAKLEWTDAGIRLTGHHHPAGVDFGLGEHGELLTVRGDSERADLTWDGTFSNASPSWGFSWNLVRNAFVYLPAHTAHLTAESRMRAFVFDGLVTVRREYVDDHRKKQQLPPKTIVFEANYRAGQLMSARVAEQDPDPNPDPPIPGYPPTGSEYSYEWTDGGRVSRVTSYLNGGFWTDEYEWDGGDLIRSSTPNSEFKYSRLYFYDEQGLEHVELLSPGRFKGLDLRYVHCDPR